MTSKKPQLAFTTRVDWLTGQLRVDQIRHDTLVQLVATWAEPQAREEVLDALERLSEAVQGPAESAERLDALVDAIDDAAGMEYAQIDLSLSDLRRMRDELDRVIGELSPKASAWRSGAHREGGAAA